MSIFQASCFYVDCMFNVGWFGEDTENLGEYYYNSIPMVNIYIYNEIDIDTDTYLTLWGPLLP